MAGSVSRTLTVMKYLACEIGALSVRIVLSNATWLAALPLVGCMSLVVHPVATAPGSDFVRSNIRGSVGRLILNRDAWPVARQMSVRVNCQRSDF